MQDPNSYQVGGTHYKSEYEHWDLVLNCNLGYLDGVATKYMTRWRKAARPVQDLQKTLHYVEKMMMGVNACYPRLRMPVSFCRTQLSEFFQANEITNGDDIAVITGLVAWQTHSDLLVVHTVIRGLLSKCELPKAVPAARPVPLEDSNRHADRATPLDPRGDGSYIGPDGA